MYGMRGRRGAWIKRKMHVYGAPGRLHASHGRTTKMREVSIAQSGYWAANFWSNEEPSAHSKKTRGAEAMFVQGPGLGRT